ncbi:phage tail tip lysozyme [Enterococcus faecalis]|uniref:phage tail tip lysozyme n=1 Tax=Enterococcus faecalis TaxID=1351 RepID=UPI0017805A4C|nr:phage tail tip lysozyme [Enterococcus faecalis]MBD9949138.1 CHAP domain-containing protein [Enterococcus faecalis]
MSKDKRSWKEKIKVSTQVEEQLKKNLTLKPREATKIQKAALRTTKKEFKLSKKTYKQSLQKHKLMVKKGNQPLTINHMLEKKKYIEQKKKRQAQKIAYRRTKKADDTRIVNQVKKETKASIKRSVIHKATHAFREEETLNQAVTLYEKQQQARINMRMVINTTRHVKNVSVKTAKSSYGLGNRLFNYSRGRGFQRTPEEFRLSKQLTTKIHMKKLKIKTALQAKKEGVQVQLMQSIFSGKQSMKKILLLLIKNPISWGFILLLFVLFLFSGVAGSSLKPAIVQDEKELTETWTYVSRLDAEHTDDNNQFYSDIDAILFYMNYRYDDFKLVDMDSTGTKNFETVLSDLWTDLNGKKPDYQLKTMQGLETDKESGYFIDQEQYAQYQELKKELGYKTLDDLLSFPVQTESLIVHRRYGYEKVKEKLSLFKSIEVLLEPNQPFQAPMKGTVKDVLSENSFVLEQPNRVRLTIHGVSSQRLRKGVAVDEGTFLGNVTNPNVTIRYEKYDREEKSWYFVNPAFYFPKVTYTQTTSLGNLDFSPGASVEKRAQAVYDYLSKKGYTKEGISAILGNFSVESGINPKRAEGDYLNPPVGAYGNSWDEPSWLSMGGPQIYGGRFPNILHRGLGLGQWTDTADGSRRHTLLLDYAKNKKKPWYDLQLQLDFIFEGDAPGSRMIAENVAKSTIAKSIPELTIYFLNAWEGNPGDKASERIQAAQNWFSFFSRSGTPIGGSGSEVFEQYKDKMAPLPTDKETKPGQGWPGNAYAPGNCTWFVFNRFAQVGKHIHPTMGNANQWVYNYSQTPGATLEAEPKKGDAVIFTNGVAGSSTQYGHVAYVEHVNSDGSFVISEMNVNGEYSMNWRVLKKEAGEYFMRVP